SDVQKRTWVTRKGVHLDRIACAWLIRRFIDQQPTFKFVPARGYTPAPREIRFDMFDAEFTHDGELCSFEVMLRAFDLRDPALRALAEVIHDVDLKDSKFDREETGGIDHLIAGIAWLHGDDEARLEHGSAVFDALHAYFARPRAGGKGGGPPPRCASRCRSAGPTPCARSSGTSSSSAPPASGDRSHSSATCNATSSSAGDGSRSGTTRRASRSRS